MSWSEEDIKRVVKKAIEEREAEIQTKRLVLGVNPTENSSHVDHVCGCPDCYCNFVEKTKKFDYECSECGLPLPDSLATSEKACPQCGENPIVAMKR